MNARPLQRSRQNTLLRVRQSLLDDQQELSQIETNIFNHSVMRNMINVTKVSQRNNAEDISDINQDRAIDITGYWMGNYGDNGFEIIQIKRINDKFVAVKV